MLVTIGAIFFALIVIAVASKSEPSRIRATVGEETNPQTLRGGFLEGGLTNNGYRL